MDQMFSSKPHGDPHAAKTEATRLQSGSHTDNDVIPTLYGGSQNTKMQYFETVL